MITLILVRHGSTEWTRSGRLQGSVDIDLSPHGIAEVQALRPAIASLGPRSAVSSPLARTASTARLLGFPDAKVDSRWAEAGLGEWEGLLSSDLGEDYALWRRGRLAPPGSEPHDAVRERIADSIAGLDAHAPVLVATHGGVIRSVLDHYVGLATGSLVPVAAASITVLEIDGGEARLALYNWRPVLGVPAGSAPVPAAGAESHEQHERRDVPGTVPTSAAPSSGTSVTEVAHETFLNTSSPFGHRSS